MSERDFVQRRLSGTGDIGWIAGLGGVTALLVVLLIGHLRVEFEIYRLASEADQLASEREQLDRERERLLIEREVRSDSVDVPTFAAEQLGMHPVRPEQIFEVEASR